MAISISKVTTPGGVAGSGSTVTYSAVSIGTAAVDRIIAITPTSEDATAGAVIGVKVGTYVLTNASSAQQSASNASIWQTLVPSGTTSDVVITYTNTAPNSTNNRISIYTITGADSSTFSGAADVSTDMDATSPLSAAFTIPTGGGAIGAVSAAISSTTAKTWTNLTEAEEVATGSYTHTTAQSTTAGTPTVTCQGSTNGEDGAMAIAVFQAPSNRQTLNKPFTLQPILAQ